MANVSWKFYRSRRRIDIHALVSSGRVIDYPTYLSYCTGARVIPASQQDFDLEFGPALSKNLSARAPVQTQAEVSPRAAVQSDGLEATVWLAGVEGDTSSSTAPTPSKSKKKKSKEDPQE